MEVTDRELARARRWLAGRGLGGSPAAEPLLAVRLTARDRGWRVQGVLFLILIVPTVAWTAWARRHGHAGGTGLANLGGQIGLNAALAVGAWWGLVGHRRAMREVAGRLPQRVAHPAAAGSGAVAGRWYLLAAALTYGGGLAVGVASAVGAGLASDRGLAAVFTAGVLALAVIAVVAFVNVLRRPTVAADPTSLVVDDLLRTEDARVALAPYPLALALVTAVNAVAEMSLLWVFGGYAVAGALLWGLAMWRHGCLPRPDTRTADPATDGAAATR